MNAIDELERCVRLARRPRLVRIASSPYKVLYSNAINRFCAMRGTVRTRRVRTFWGTDMEVVFPERVSTFIYRFGFFEADVSALFALYVHPGMTIFDIGAHYGYMTLLCSESVGAAGRVHAFEPTPSTFEVLKHNAATRANVTLNNVAVCDKPGALKLVDFGVRHSAWNSAAGGRLDQATLDHLKPVEFTAPCVSIDSYIDQTSAKPDFIKIDAEKAEMWILRGAQRTLERERPVITIEFGDEPGTAPEARSSHALRHLVERDYQLFELDGRQLVRVQLKELYPDAGNMICVPAERPLMPRASS